MSEFNNAPIPNGGPAATNGMRPAPIMPSPAPQGTTVCGIVGVVFGALGLVLSFIPIINNIFCPRFNHFWQQINHFMYIQSKVKRSNCFQIIN